MIILKDWLGKEKKAVCKKCGNEHVDIKTEKGFYCMDCWHEYPEGFKTVGWNFV